MRALTEGGRLEFGRVSLWLARRLPFAWLCECVDTRRRQKFDERGARVFGVSIGWTFIGVLRFSKDRSAGAPGGSR